METNTVSVSFDFIKKSIDRRDNDKPLFIGVNGPQGSGKTYLTSKLVEQLSVAYPSLRIVGFAIDDFYLTYQEQQQLNSVSRHNKLLQGRGLPGTHDLDLLKAVLDDIIKGKPLRIPQYDKSQHSGQGDRAPESDWIDLPKADVVILEGWFTGFEALSDHELRLAWFSLPQESAAVKIPLFNLEDINDRLKQYQQVWDIFDYFVFIEADDFHQVYTWRLQQELASIEANGSGMTDDEVAKFVDRYMPVYEIYYRRMCEHGIVKAGGRNLKLAIDGSRNLLKSQLY